MLTRQQTVTHINFMQISGNIIEKSIPHYNSANIADNRTNEGSMIIIKIFLKWPWQTSMQI